MKYALVIIDAPATDIASLQSLANFADNAQPDAQKAIKSTMLNVGSYLIPLSDGLLLLSVIVAETKYRKLKTRTLFFDKEPEWVVSN